MVSRGLMHPAGPATDDDVDAYHEEQAGLARLRECTVPGTLVTLDNGERGVVIGRDDDDFGEFVLLTMLGRKKRSADDAQRYRFKADEVVRVEDTPCTTPTLFLVCIPGITPLRVLAAYADKWRADEHRDRARRRDIVLHVRVGSYFRGEWRTL